MTWAVIVHGGAKTIAPEDEQANRDGCIAAVEAARGVLATGGTAVAAVEAAVRVLESDPTFNAGVGAERDADGIATLDAAVMDGSDLGIGAVAAVREVVHPVSVACRLLMEAPVLLVAEGAQRFARRLGADEGIPATSRSADHADKQGGGHDTVGCVAIDRNGRIAAAVSTGGLGGAMPGRVGDSVMPGCGLYADDTVGATVLTGDGESIARTMLAARIIQALELGHGPHAAIALALARLERVGGEAGAIAIDRGGHIGWAHTSSHMAVAWRTEEMAHAETQLSRGEML